VNLASFADLAVRLVNSAVCDAEADPLRSCAAFGEFVADRPFLAVPVTPYDLDRLRLLRTDLVRVFADAAAGAEPAAADRLNGLMMIHPVHPVLVRHDGEPWHVHLNEAGSATDRYAAGAIISLTLLISQFGADRLGSCAIASCDRVFIDGSSNKSRRYCADHSAARGNVTSLRVVSHFATDLREVSDTDEPDESVASAAS
jgi:predicted RNA-binding Zn ribbon-like protein